MSTASLAPPARPTLYSEARQMVAHGGPIRPTHQHLRALWFRLEPIVTAAGRLDRAATSHADCAGCPLCDLRGALRGAEAGR